LAYPLGSRPDGHMDLSLGTWHNTRCQNPDQVASREVAVEILPGLRMINTPFGEGRQINIWLLSGQRHMLVDTGVVGSPGETILPYLDNVGLTAADLALVANLHAHADHIGGNGELFAASGEALAFGAHEIDVPAIEDHCLLATRVYGLRDPEGIRALLARCGAHVPIHYQYHGSETIDLQGLTLKMIHAPGHTEGNLAVYDPTHRALIHGESVMGPSRQTTDGLWTTPFGVHPLAYRQTLDALGSLDFDLYLSSHMPPADRAWGREHIEASLASLERFEQACHSALSQEPRDLDEMVIMVAAEEQYAMSPTLGRQIGSVVDSWQRWGRAQRNRDGSLQLTA